VLAAGLVPWITLLPRTLTGNLRNARREPATGLLLLWAAFVFVFFSISQSKLATYILPMMPALALLMGRTLAQMSARRLGAHLAVVAGIAILLAATVLALALWPRTAKLAAAASPASVGWFIGALALLAAGAGVGARWCRRGRSLLGAASGALGALLLAEATLLGLSQLPHALDQRELSRQLAPLIERYRHFYCVNDYVQTAPFYLRRTCTPVAYRGELDFGLSLEPWRGIATLREFVATWKRDDSALAILRPADFRFLESLGTPMRVIYTAPSLVAVVR
jgi:4-amino-4-deoxy-L-arabinose transferase-like glycosyltransferase